MGKLAKWWVIVSNSPKSNFLKNLLIILAVLAFGWSLVLSMPVFNQYKKVLNQEDYQKAIFKVISVHYDPGRVSKAISTSSTWFARGLIRGKEERFSLVAYVKQPHSESELMRLVPIGSEIDVWYNPEQPNAIIAGETLRVLIFNENTFTDTHKYFKGLLLVAYGPFFLVLMLLVFVKIFYGGSNIVPSEES